MLVPFEYAVVATVAHDSEDPFVVRNFPEFPDCAGKAYCATVFHKVEVPFVLKNFPVFPVCDGKVSPGDPVSP